MPKTLVKILGGPGAGAGDHGPSLFCKTIELISKSFVTSVKFSLGHPTFQPLSEPM